MSCRYSMPTEASSEKKRLRALLFLFSLAKPHDRRHLPHIFYSVRG
jgi:hypothetical protein